MRAAAAVLALASLVLASQGGWIHGKAWLAQQLLLRAWDESSRTGQPTTPWPGADTWPVARLIVPRLGLERVVLAGATGRTLAFGPGHWSGTSRPGAAGESVLAGHRDTHFAFLQHLEVGDRIVLEQPSGRRQGYRVTGREVVHERQALAPPLAPSALTLITCFPFSSPTPGGPLRFLVRAVADESDSGLLPSPVSG